MGLPFVGYLAVTLILAVGSRILSDATEKKPKKRKDPKTAHNVNTRSSREPLKVCYGQFRTGVNKTFWHVKNPYLYIICEIGEGPIAGIMRDDDKTLYNTTATELPSDNPPKVYLDDILWTDYNDLVYLEFFNGGSTQTVSTTLETATSGTDTEWDQALRYTSYLLLRLEYDRDQFNGEPEVTVEIQGLYVSNPLTAITEYTNNPALCAYDFMTRSSERGGLGISADRIDIPSLEDSVDYCTDKEWTCNMPIVEDVAAIDNLNQILMNFRGDIIQSSDKFKIKFRDLNTESVSMALDMDDVLRRDDVKSSLTIEQPYSGNRPNAIRATHYSKEKNYKVDDIITSDATAISAEGDLREEQIELFGLSEPKDVQKMSNYYLERLRLNRRASFTAVNRTMALEPLDLITLTHTMPGWTAQTLRILGIGINGDFTVSLDCIEEADTLYDDTYNLTAHDYDITNLPRPTDDVSPVINVTHTPETYFHRLRTFTRWLIDFDPPAATDYPFWDYAEIWLKIGSGEWRYMTNCRTNYQVDPVEEGETYYIKIRSVSTFGMKENFDSTRVWEDTISLATTAPDSLSAIIAIANGDSVSIYGTPLTDPDIEGYEIRLGDTWASGIFVSFNKNISLRLNGVRPGTHTFWAAAKDNGGNYSPTPVSATVEVFIPPGYSELATYGSWSWDFGSGTFVNTEQVTFETEDSLKCSHTSSVLTGTYTSGIHDLNAVEKVRIWGDFRVGFVNSETTWSGVYGSESWETVDPTLAKTWAELFSPTTAAKLEATLRYRDDPGDAWSEITFFELLCAEINSRYISVVVTITDPSLDANLYLKELNMYAYEGPQ